MLASYSIVDISIAQNAQMIVKISWMLFNYDLDNICQNQGYWKLFCLFSFLHKNYSQNVDILKMDLNTETIHETHSSDILFDKQQRKMMHHA